MHLLVLIAASGIMTWQAMYKGWMMFVMVPLLFVIVPLLVVVHVKALKPLAAGVRSANRAAWIQLVGALMFYACLPGMGDTEEALLFARFEVNINTPEVQIASWLSFIGLGLFLFGSYRAFRLVASYRKKHDKV